MDTTIIVHCMAAPSLAKYLDQYKIKYEGRNGMLYYELELPRQEEIMNQLATKCYTYDLTR